MHLGGGAFIVTACQKWSKFAKKAACVQPTRAAAERVFSMLKGLYDDTQSCVLEDHQASALMVQGQRRKTVT